MTKDFALDQPLGNCGRVDGDERHVASVAGRVNRARRHFLACTTLAGEDGGCVARRERLDRAMHLTHRSALADQAGRSRQGRAAFVHREAGLPLAHVARRGLEQGEQRHGVERLREEVRRPQLHRFHRAVDIAVCGDHDDGKLGIASLDALQELHPRAAGEHQVAHDEIGPPSLDLALSFGGVFDGAHVMAPVCDAQRQHLAQGGLVVDHQDGKAWLFHAYKLLGVPPWMKPSSPGTLECCVPGPSVVHPSCVRNER
jgi:hypothetical protein